MSEIVTLLLPFFGLILLGYAAGYFRLVNAEGLAGLEFFTFYCALPVLFFHLIASTPPGTLQSWSFVATTTFATYCAFAVAFSIGALLNGGNVPEATVEGLLGSTSNTAYLAPALVIAAFGAPAAAPTGLIFSFDTAVLLIITPLMMALGGTMRTDPAKLAEGIARQVLLNPIIIAVILGFIAFGLGLRLPAGIDALLTLLRSAATPLALFVVGVGLAFRPFRPVTVEIPIVVAVKLIAHPLIVYLLLSWIGGFDPLWVHTAVLIAALPPAASVAVLARGHNVFSDRISMAVLIGTAASVVTVTIALIVIVNEVLPGNPFR
jgi:predicted permease